MQFHEHLRTICEDGRITAREIAHEAGLHEDSITRYMAGLRPSERSRLAVLDALRVLLAKREREVESAKVVLQKSA